MSQSKADSKTKSAGRATGRFNNKRPNCSSTAQLRVFPSLEATRNKIIASSQLVVLLLSVVALTQLTKSFDCTHLDVSSGDEPTSANEIQTSRNLAQTSNKQAANLSAAASDVAKSTQAASKGKVGLSNWRELPTRSDTSRFSSRRTTRPTSLTHN